MNIDDYIHGSHYRSYTLEMRCPKCGETYYCPADEEYGRRSIDDAYCPLCHVDLVEVGEADMGDKWDTNEGV